MSQLPKIQASKEEIKILRRARKRKSLSIKDVNFWKCEELVKKGAFHKQIPPEGRGAGWPLYRLTRRARKLLEYLDAHPRQ